jgi:prophage regulatory protein
MINKVLRRAEVERATGLPRSTLYSMMARNLFPKPIRLGARAVGWLETDITAWQRARVSERDGADKVA